MSVFDETDLGRHEYRLKVSGNRIEWLDDKPGFAREVEARIPLKAIGVDFTKPVTMGLAFRIWDNEPLKRWNWPVSADENQPATWGTLVFEQ